MSTLSRRLCRHVRFYRKHRSIYGRFTVLHTLVLKGEESWRTVDGFLINTARGGLVFSLRGDA